MAATVRRLMFVVGVAAVVGAACSSVPDVHFVDGGESSGSGSGSGGTSGQPVPPDWSCPDKPPPAGLGICCGRLLCLKCATADCARCEQEGCPGTVSAACCPRNPVQMECLASSQCL